MRKKLKNLFNINTTFKSILIYTLTPCLIMVILSFAFLFFSVKLQISTHVSQSANTIETIYQNIEYKIKNVSTSFNLYSNDVELLSALRDYENNEESIQKMQTVLDSLCSTVPYVDSAIIYNKASNTVITPDTIQTIPDFFSTYKYNDYSQEYWDNYKFSISKHRFLSPTTVSHNGKEKIIVPLAYSRLGKNYLNKLIIFNIDFGAILADENMTLDKKDYYLGIINRLTKTFYSPVYNYSPQPLSEEFNTIFHKHITYNGTHTFNGEKTLIVYNSPSKSVLGYSYFTTIPYSVLIKQAAYPAIVLILLISSTSLFAIFLAYKFSKKAYAPIKQLEISLNPDSDDNNSFETITKSISEIQQRNEQLSSQYENSLTKIQNMYLINLLNTESENISEDINSYFDFKYNYFCSVIYSIAPKEHFTVEQDYYTYETLIKKLFICIYEEYSASFDTFTLPAENNVFYILLNIPSSDLLDKINDIAQTINSILEEDKELIDVMPAIGGIYEGLSGLKKSHNAAMFLIDNHITATTPELNPSIKILKRKEKNTSTFDINKESTLTNYLTSFKIKLAREFIEGIIAEDINKNLSQGQLSKMYVQIITAITKVLDSKKIEHSILENESVLDSVPELLATPLVELNSIVFKLLDVFDLHVSSYSNNLDIVQITNYIDEHYTTDIGLDSLARIFNTSSPYLSHLIKVKLGINFSEYLTKIRIDRAIELMKSGNVTVNELFSQVGFNNRNAFTKAFKRVTGTTPSEYKKSNLK